MDLARHILLAQLMMRETARDKYVNRRLLTHYVSWSVEFRNWVSTCTCVTPGILTYEFGLSLNLVGLHVDQNPVMN